MDKINAINVIILSDDQFVAIILYKTTPYVKYIGLII